ncbi:hypothetical protein ACGFMM_15685 [Streptomyces sp. NPDC048604]|uniref:hypothetical protein n=1 Tax=Streptomyces sp. NPDC048604 TaxID=3365578 RepID=UPI003712BCC9
MRPLIAYTFRRSLSGRVMETAFLALSRGIAHPALSRAIGLLSLCVLAAALVVLVPQLAEQLTKPAGIAQRTGTFTSPIDVPAWGNIAIGVATLAAGAERALRLRLSHLLDSA